MHLLDDRLLFPDPITAPDHGLLAIGGDLSVDRLLLAYRSGIFPWYNDGEPICWWSPDPRMVFDLRTDQPLKITKSMRQSQRNKGYEIRENTCFIEVMNNCALSPRTDQDGTWINDEMLEAYSRLHELGHVKSVEVFKNDELVGGLYGMDLPERKIFCGESMFSIATDASKKLRSYSYCDALVICWFTIYLSYKKHFCICGKVKLIAICTYTIKW